MTAERGHHDEQQSEIDDWFTDYTLMDPELHANMPATFAEYTTRNPDILPNYRPFAHDMVNLLGRRPDKTLLLRGDHGIGKSTVVASAILKTAAEQGYQPVGSLAFGLDYDVEVYFDSHQTFVTANQGSAWFSPERITHLGRSWQRQALTEEIRARFTSASRRGIMLLDEIGPIGGDRAPWLAQFIFDEARHYGTTLVVTHPNLIAGRNQDLANRTLGELALVAGVEFQEVQIPEQPIDLQQTPHVATTFGIEPDFAELFAAHPRLSRLRLATFIIDMLGRRKSEHFKNDETIWSTDETKGLLLQRVFAAESRPKLFGLNSDEAKEVKALLQPPEDYYTSYST